ncbi:hypothetical protein MLD38_036290 [Melastoma candidum]|uniref:Uncharacterized protein n=1 Tax=Melastoma candidum TaxID=119954 RepID=A0ACB9LIL2_9MYRT|nr:hypothetical protein MLD38_036290 [Melastoma candidum]
MKAVSGFGGTEKNEFESVDWANDVNTCWLFEESEQTKRAGCVGCASLCLELDKERNAAATATDEVIAMILQLQREKASAEREAKQYWRVTQEKFAFDATEMNILNEILLKREREKHFLEKKVEAIRQIVCTNKRSDNGLLVYDGVQKWAVSSSKGDDVESMRTAGGNNGSNQDVREKATIYLSDGGPLITNEPLSACCGLSLEIEESLLPTERLGERNIDGTPANVFSNNMMDAHSAPLIFHSTVAAALEMTHELTMLV